MKRRSDRSKTKAEPKEEESQEKAPKKSHRHSRRKRRSSSSDSERASPKKELEIVPKHLEVQVQDIELPQGDNPAQTVAAPGNEVPVKLEEAQEEWKEDSSFWTPEAKKAVPELSAEETPKEKEESSVWKVQSANGAGGEIQKLKICRQRPSDSPELGDSSLRKRLSRGPKDSRSTDDSNHEESEKDTKKSKHRTRTSSRNSPLISPTVVCDVSENSPTKIKIINVSLINSDGKGANLKTATNETTPVSQKDSNSDMNETQNDSQVSEIALPAEDPPPKQLAEAESKASEEQQKQETETGVTSASKDTPSSADAEDSNKSNSNTPQLNVEENSSLPPKHTSSPSPSPKKEDAKSSRSSSGDDSDSSVDTSKPRKVKKKRRRDLQSSVQRKLSTSTSPKHKSSDSEDDKEKKEDGPRELKDTKNTDSLNNKENESTNSINNDKDLEDNQVKPEVCIPMPRKRRWGSSKANRPNKKPVLNISTDSLKSLIPDVKPVPAEELQLSVEEEEEGQLDDDDEEEDEVVVLVAKEEEKQERERQREERQKEREKELEERRKSRKERLEKSKPEQPPPNDASDKARGAAARKILLLTDDAKKLAQSPSPPRHKPASVLYITHLVRPFTVQQLKNLLLRTGTIAENGFWIDKIKSKCYVEYTTEDAAVETRHALHGVRWPTSNPKTLLVEFASHDDLVMAQALSEEPDVPRKAEPLTMVEGWVAEQARIKERSRKAVREWDVGKPEHPDEILEFDLKKEKKEQERRARKERPHRSHTPENEPPARKPRRKEEDAPAKLLDDLFRKTKTSPCIYWLPLTQEQIAVKEEMRRQHMAEHERRLAELKKAELARRERERRNRK